MHQQHRALRLAAICRRSRCPGDEIRLAAGTYTNVQHRAGITQTVYLSKTLTIRGGYTLSNWDIPDPAAHPTTLNAQGRGRVFYITGSISPTIEGLQLIKHLGYERSAH